MGMVEYIGLIETLFKMQDIIQLLKQKYQDRGNWETLPHQLLHQLEDVETVKAI